MITLDSLKAGSWISSGWIDNSKGDKMQIREAAKVRNRQTTTWYVTSDTTPGTEYIVHNKRNAVSHHKVWTCNCLSFTEREQFRNGECKHIAAVKHELFMKQAAQEATSAVLSEMTVTVKQVLDLIVKTLNGPRAESKQLWDVLTILRGPDNDDHNLKEETTAALRGAIGLLSGSGTGAVVSNEKPFGHNFSLWTGSTDYYRLISELTKQHNAQEHFAIHYRSALIALKSLGYIK
jgi:hypothetical protein